MCISFLDRFSQRLRDRRIDTSDPSKVEAELMRACGEAKNRDERFVSVIAESNQTDNITITVYPVCSVITLGQ